MTAERFPGQTGWIKNSLAVRADYLRRAAKRCRKVYASATMVVPAGYVADVYERAASLFDEAIKQLTVEPPT